MCVFAAVSFDINSKIMLIIAAEKGKVRQKEAKEREGKRVYRRKEVYKTK
jgi:hypothetical protein